MRLLSEFLRDDRGTTIVEYSLTFAIFGIFAIVGLLAFTTQSEKAMVDTRARMSCNSVNLTPNSTASVDGSGTITCG